MIPTYRKPSSWLGLALLASLTQGTVFADSAVLAPITLPTEDVTVRATVGMEHGLGDGSNGILIEAEFYGLQVEGIPNNTKRYFWLRANVLKDLSQSDAPLRSTPDKYEITLVPFASSEYEPRKIKEYGSHEVQEESHHRFGTLQAMRDIRVGVNQGFRLRAYSYSWAGSPADSVSYFVNVDLLGYAIDSIRTQAGNEAWIHSLHLLALDGGIRLTFLEKDRVHFGMDLLHLSASGSVPLNGTDEEPGRGIRASIQSGLFVNLYRKDFRKLLGSLRLKVGAYGESGDDVRTRNGEAIEEIQQDQSQGGHTYVGAEFTYYFD